MDTTAAMRGNRWWGVSGVVFAVLFLIGFALLGDSGETGEEIIAFHDDNRVRSIIAFLCFAASALAYIWFTAAVRNVLALAEPEPRGLTALGYGAGLVTATLIVVGAAPAAALGDTANDAGANAADAYALVSSMTYPLITIGIGMSSLLALAVGLVTLRTGVLPRWFGWASLVAAPLILVAVLFLPIFVFLLWVATAGVVLLMREDATNEGAMERASRAEA